MKIHDEVNLLGAAQEQLAMLVHFGDPQGRVFIDLILTVGRDRFSGFNNVYHNPSRLRKLREVR